GLGSLLGKAFKIGLKTVGKMMGGAPREQ
uniref:Caerulein precursor fragment B1 n=1 Tax=Xenopus borealis TaxID=8354 RepID=CPFB1_XENBO|nr:RecName: Full=Caerulein precursor fragment B1; Short=CPF-B1; Contains: RecName: Full=Caerulein precursor fragment B2; Short=CPF-B2 [Xenopus borealis]